MKYTRFVICLSVLWSSVADCCTDFVIQTKDRCYINGRTLEFAQDLNSQIKIFPRNQKVISQNPDMKKGVEWTSKYGFLGVTALGRNLTFEGLNELGLSFGYLWLPNVTQYPQVGPEEMGAALDFVDFGAWVLGNFSTVEEVKHGLKSVRIWGHPVPPLPGIPPVHAAIHDANGNHLVVEFVGGEMKVYNNPVGVLTNSPPFDWQLINLQNYIHLSAVNADSVQFGKLSVAQTGQGSGLIGIPGDWTPPSRFVKIATYLRFAKPASQALEGVNLAEHLINTVDIPIGEIVDQGQIGDYTQWAVIKDLTNRVFYFRSYKETCFKMIDLKRINFKYLENKSLSFDIGKGYIDMTGSFNLQ